MTTVAILPVETKTGSRSYQAFSGRCFADGSTAGQALDALSQQFPDLDAEPVIVVQRFQPDQFFTAVQQQRLLELMQQWRDARDKNGVLAPAKQAELDALVDAELVASGQRAAAVAQGLGR